MFNKRSFRIVWEFSRFLEFVGRGGFFYFISFEF